MGSGPGCGESGPDSSVCRGVGWANLRNPHPTRHPDGQPTRALPTRGHGVIAADSRRATIGELTDSRLAAGCRRPLVSEGPAR